MQLQTFIKRLQSQKAVNYCYRKGELEGMVSVWQDENRYVLTWEECPAGGQYNEYSYTRDEKHEFKSIEEILGFLDQNALEVTDFTP